jgi:hypothetical protein
MLIMKLGFLKLAVKKILRNSKYTEVCIKSGRELFLTEIEFGFSQMIRLRSSSLTTWAPYLGWNCGFYDAMWL